MSDVMLFGVLKMPYEMAMYSELSRLQFYQRVQQLVARVEAQGEQSSSQETVAVYGYCPKCGAKGVQRERRPDGNDKCVNGHTYLSSKATPPKRPWVGLTEQEVVDLCDGRLTTADQVRIARATEDRIKEKNT